MARNKKDKGFLGEDLDFENEKPERKSRYTVENDYWDRRHLDKLLKQVPEFRSSRRTLVDNIAGEPGYDIAGDLMWSLLKTIPRPLDEGEVRPDRRVNVFVRDEANELDQFAELRQYTRGDDIGSALAFSKLEPDLEVIYDKMRRAQELADQHQQEMEELARALQEERDAEQIWNDWTQENDPNADENSDEVAGMQQRMEDARQKREEAEAQANETAAELEGEISAQSQDVQQQLEKAVENAEKEMSAIEAASRMWGQEPGELHRLSADKRLELAEKVRKNSKFRRVAEIFGSMQRYALNVQKHRVPFIRAEMVDIERGSQLSQTLPAEFLKLDDEDAELLFMKDFLENSLLQYRYEGEERLCRGGIIYVHDGSGSMSGDQEVWAKAVGLALLHIAKMQDRPFVAIQFGSRNQQRVDDFSDTKNLDPMKVIDFAEFFFAGGTDFETPLNTAVRMLEEEYANRGAIRADIVFATDGFAPVSDKWKKEFESAKKKLDFKVWGINIGGRVQDEPMHWICDGKVVAVKKLVDLGGSDVHQIFEGV